MPAAMACDTSPVFFFFFERAFRKVFRGVRVEFFPSLSLSPSLSPPSHDAAAAAAAATAEEGAFSHSLLKKKEIQLT
jgi:hypothetical protein